MSFIAKERRDGQNKSGHKALCVRSRRGLDSTDCVGHAILACNKEENKQKRKPKGTLQVLDFPAGSTGRRDYGMESSVLS